MKPTWLQTEEELRKIAEFPEYSSISTLMTVYAEIGHELNQILSKMPFHISHGYNSRSNHYELVWYPHGKIGYLFIVVKSFDGKKVHFHISPHSDYSDGVFITLEKEKLFGWLSNAVDEIFIQAI